MIRVDAAENGFKEFLFYDIEVFKEDALVVFKDINKETVGVFHNDFEGIKDLIEGKVLVGYNNYNYDDYILSAMMKNKTLSNIKEINDDIISGLKPMVALSPEIESLDCFQQINVAKSGLKKVEANLGMSIEETSVPFDIDRKLTNSEYTATLKYCCHDVEATIDIFKLRWNQYFRPKLMVLKMMPESLRDKAIRWNTTTIAAHVLTGGEKVARKSKYQLEVAGHFDRGDLFSVAPPEVVDMWTGLETDIGLNREYKTGKVTLDDLDCLFEFGFGGLHGVSKTGKHFYNVTLLDVASMYPNIILNLGVLGDKPTERYQEIVEKRLIAKKTDKNTADALKLVINSAYGLMKNEYSLLFNPAGAVSVCICGQIALYDLCMRLHDAGYVLVNINTDGVAFCGGDDEVYKEIQKEWEQDYNLTLEASKFTQWYQKDVNNYVAEFPGGGYKVKGGDVSTYNEPDTFDGDFFEIRPGYTWTSTNSLGIISRCVVNKLMNGIEPDVTVQNYKDKPLLFQYVLQAGNTFAGTFDKAGKQYQKVNRVFAAKGDGVLLQKFKEDGSHCRFADAPENMYVYNGDLSDFDIEQVNLSYYSSLAMKVCDRWS